MYLHIKTLIDTQGPHHSRVQNIFFSFLSYHFIILTTSDLIEGIFKSSAGERLKCNEGLSRAFLNESYINCAFPVC